MPTMPLPGEPAGMGGMVHEPAAALGAACMTAMSRLVDGLASRIAPGADGWMTSRCAISRALGDVPEGSSLRPRSVTSARALGGHENPELRHGDLAEVHAPFFTEPSFTALSSESVYAHAT